MNIYLDIDGTLIHEDLTENYGKAAAGLEEFLIALRPFNTYWLTTHCRDGNPDRTRKIMKQHVSEALYPDIDRILLTVWDSMKTEGIDWSKDLIWFDNDIFEAEWERFKTANSNQQVIEVDLKSNPDQLLEISEDIVQTYNGRYIYS